MDGTKQNGQAHEPNESQKPVADQMTDLLANAAGALAEVAVRTVAKRTRKAAADRMP